MIKRFLFFVVANLLLSLLATAQVIKGQASPRIEEPLPPHPAYDSLTIQVTNNDYKKLIGQVIYGPKKLSVCNPLYEYEEYMLPEMQGKYFIVIDATDIIYGSRSQTIEIKLKELNTGKIISCYLSNGENYAIKTLTPLICMGYIEKQKKLNIGRKFIALQKVDFLYDIRTGNFINYNIGSRWICTDIKIFTMKDRCYEKPYFIFKDSIGTEVALNMKFGSSYIAPTSHTEDYTNDIFTDEEKHTTDQIEKKQKAIQEEIQKQLEKTLAEQEAIKAEQTRVNNLIKKYGKYFGTKIAHGQVALGMTKDMCNEAWGEPRSIRQTATASGTYEKWLYGRDSYLSFKGNMLVEIQD